MTSRIVPQKVRWGGRIARGSLLGVVTTQPTIMCQGSVREHGCKPEGRFDPPNTVVGIG